MTVEEVLQAARQALEETSAQHLSVNFAVLRNSVWIVHFSYQSQEWAIRVPRRKADSPHSLRSELRAQIRCLF